MPMSDVNFYKLSSCLSWQVLNKSRGRLTEPVVFFIDHYIHYFISFQFCFDFPHNYHMVKKEKNKTDQLQLSK